MSSRRFFIISESPEPGETVVLSQGESHHISRVLRSGSGEDIRMLDGRGGVFRGKISGREGEGLLVEIVGVERSARPPSVDIAMALTRANRMDTAVEKCVEIGIRKMIPLASARSLWKGGEREEGARSGRLRRKVLAACKQSGNPWLTEIGPVASAGALAKSFGDYRMVLVADEKGREIGSILEKRAFEGEAGQGLMLGIVGPEGGFTEEEMKIFTEAGAVPVSLGANRLRSETAAICMAWAMASVPLGPAGRP